MAASLLPLRRLLRLSGSPTLPLSRSAFTARRDDPRNPNWLSIGLTLASTVAVWVLIFKQHNDDTIEYERRKAERES